jgi:hypothetical protein
MPLFSADAKKCPPVLPIKQKQGDEHECRRFEGACQTARIVSTIALVWMVFGVVAWLMDWLMPASALEKMDSAQRGLYAARPQWLFVIYAIAVVSGLIGAIGLLVRREWARTAFWISLAAVIVQFGYTFLVMDAVRALGATRALPFPIVIFLIGVFLIWCSDFAHRRGWLR